MSSYAEYLLELIKDETDYQETRIRHCYDNAKCFMELYQQGVKKAGETKKNVLEKSKLALGFYQEWEDEIKKYLSESEASLNFLGRRKIEKFVSGKRKEMESALNKINAFLSKIVG